jgi:hypothetical protein
MSVRAQATSPGRRANTPPDTVVSLEQFAGRGAGTNAERRAALWLAGQLASRQREVAVEPFWCRPNWALAQAWHVMLALAGSLVAVASPRVGGAMLLAALIFVIADALTGVSPGRRLTPEHASQNVVSVPPPGPDDSDTGRLHLIITANYDAGRTGLIYRDGVRSATARLRQALGGFTVGWVGWLVIDLVVLLAMAILRLEGHTGVGVGAVQLLPTVALLVVLVLLLESAATAWSPAAGDNGSGVAVALSLARALGVSPPRWLKVEVVLTGAGDGGGIGLRRHLRARRRTHRPSNTVVLGIAPCTTGALRWWSKDGPLIPLRYGKRVLALAQGIAEQQPQLGVQGHSGRGSTPALPARQVRIPAVAIGALDTEEIVPRSHQPDDVAAAISRQAHDQAVQFGLMLVDAVDAALRKPAQR